MVYSSDALQHKLNCVHTIGKKPEVLSYWVKLAIVEADSTLIMEKAKHIITNPT